MTRFAIVPILLTIAGFSGCSSQSSHSTNGPSNANHLGEVAGLISSYTGEFKKAPKSLNDVLRYENGFPLGVSALRTGEIVVTWGIKMVIEEGGGGPEGTKEIVAYEKKTPTEGGSVLLQNGTVKAMTAAEFQSAPKAKP